MTDKIVLPPWCDTGTGFQRVCSRRSSSAFPNKHFQFGVVGSNLQIEVYKASVSRCTFRHTRCAARAGAEKFRSLDKSLEARGAS